MDEIAKHARRLKKKLPEEAEIKIIQTGFNVVFQKKTVSFHYKHKSYIGGGKAVYRTKSVRFVEEGEMEVWKYLIGYKEPKAIEEKPPEEPTTNKTQLCIDHINRKVLAIKKDLKRDNNQITIHLVNLTHELKQYL